MLEVVREYAGELLEASGEGEAVRMAFAGYFKRMAEKADTEIRTGNQIAAVRRLSREQENVKAALAIMIDARPGEVHSGGANVLFCDGHVTWYVRQDLVINDPPSEADKPKIRMWNNDHRAPRDP